MAVIAERRSRYGSGKLLIAVLALCLDAIIYHKNEVRADFQVTGLFSTFRTQNISAVLVHNHAVVVIRIIYKVLSDPLNWATLLHRGG